MPPAIDRTVPRPCMICKVTKPPEAFKSARKCIECEDAVAAAAAAAFRETNMPSGHITTVQDILGNQWRMTECSDRRLIKQAYVLIKDLSPKFLGGVEPDYTVAKITDPDLKMCHKGDTKAALAFSPVPWCLAHLGFKQCTRCPAEDNVRRLDDFNLQGTGQQLRGECKSCQCGTMIIRRVDAVTERLGRAAVGETKVCNACGESKGALSFSVDHPNTCTSCRNKQAKERGLKKVAENPEEYRMCSGCEVAHLMECFDGDSKICRAKLASGARMDSKPERREYHRALNKERKYYVTWRDKKVSMNAVQYRAHLAEMQRKYYAAHSSVILLQQKTRPTSQLSNCKAKAKERGLSWELGDEVALDMIRSPCFYSGIHLPDEHTTGLDRLDSSIGYVEGNVVSCNGTVNIMKGTMSVSDFVDACTKVAQGGDWTDEDVQKILVLTNRYDGCVKRKMHAPLSFDELCGAIAENFSSDV